MTQTAARLVLGLGAVGYVLAFALVAQLRIWLGNRGQGWPRILTNALVALLFLLAVLFAVSFANNFGLTRHLSHPWRLGIAFGTAGALSIAPWLLAGALWLWRRKLEQEDRS